MGNDVAGHMHRNRKDASSARQQGHCNILRVCNLTIIAFIAPPAGASPYTIVLANRTLRHGMVGFSARMESWCASTHRWPPSGVATQSVPFSCSKACAGWSDHMAEVTMYPALNYSVWKDGVSQRSTAQVALQWCGDTVCPIFMLQGPRGGSECRGGTGNCKVRFRCSLGETERDGVMVELFSAPAGTSGEPRSSGGERVMESLCLASVPCGKL